MKNKPLPFQITFSMGMILVLSACSLFSVGSNEAQTPAPDMTATNPPAATKPSETGLRCLDEGYPCSYAEAEPDALEASFKLLDAAALALDEDETIAAAAAVIEGREDLVEMLQAPEGIFFRLKGAPPMWLINAEVFAAGAKSLGGGSGGASFNSIQIKPAGIDLSQDDGPIGESNRGEEPFKKALVLSPFWWDFGGDETQELAAYLQQVHRNYSCDECEVHHKTNTINEGEPSQTPEERLLTRTLSIDYGVSLLDYMSWEEYDLIHISTHGSQVCSGEQCAGYMMTGRFLDNPEVNEDGIPLLGVRGVGWGRTAAPGCSALNSQLSSATLSDAIWNITYEEWLGKGCATFTDRWWQFIGPDFFNANYQGKSLDDKMIFFNSCQSMKDLSLAQSVAGDNTTVLGWTEVVDVEPAGQVALEFYKHYVKNGLRANIAFTKAKTDMGERFHRDALRGFRPKGIEIESLLPPEFLSEGDEDTRGREIITLMQPVYRVDLEEEDAIPTIGIPGDGEDDEILLLLQIDGIDESQDPAGFEIHVSVDGEELEETILPQEKIDEYSYWALGLLPLPFDAGERGLVKLEAWVELPEGGQSRHVLDEIELANCGWRASLSGELAGGIKGDITFPTVTLSSANVDQLQQLAGEGYLGPTDGTDMPSANELANMPESYMLGNRQELPFMMLTPGQAATAMLERNSLAVGDQISVNLSRDDGEHIEGSFSAALTNMLPQQTFNAEGEFIWHSDSLCSMDVIIELGSNPYPESMIPAGLTP